MNKKNKIIIAIGICIIIAATVLIIGLVDSMADDEPTGTSGQYTLQPTTQSIVAPDTSAWIDLNGIAGNLATATSDESNTLGSSLPVGVITTVGGNQGYFFDGNGNLVDVNGNIIIPYNQLGNNQVGNQIANQDTTPDTQPQETIDNTEALDEPNNDTEGELGEFEINDKGVITRYLGDKENVLIPSTEQGKKVVGIGDSCFSGTSVKSVYIPASVTSIGAFAFENCTRLSTLSFDSSVTKVSIGISAFKNCVSLKTIDLPVVSSLGKNAFSSCTSLETVRLSDGSKKIGAYAFSDCTKLTTVVIPQSVDEMERGIFDGSVNQNLTVVTPADSVAWEYAESAGIKKTTHE